DDPTPLGEDGEVCEKHGEALKLFCSEEESLICCICRESRAHRTHRVFPVEEAAQDYKVTLSRLQSLKKETEKLQELKQAGELKHQEYLVCIESDGKTVSEFKQAHHFLEEQESLLLAQLNELEREIVRHQKKHKTIFGEEIIFYSALISAGEEKCKLSHREFLQVRPGGLLKKECATCISPFLPPLFLSAVNVNLDAETANPQVIISEDRKCARWDVTRTDVLHNPKRFKSSCCVLGCEGYASGRHFWDVSVEDGGIWAIGVARGSVRRKVDLKLTPEEGIWALQGDFGQYQALTSPVTPLPISCTPKKIRVFLDYERGQVEFLNAETKDSVFVFPSASFSGERVFPFFKVLLAQLTLDS
uniref:Uncharacterized protein n=1 Tax=Varanus komodoensis TaxID=61221 RepID=A0A8D2Q558_VARKO